MNYLNYNIIKQLYKNINIKNIYKHVNYMQRRHKSYELNLKIEGISLNKYIQSLQLEYTNLLTNNINNTDRYRYLQRIINILDERCRIVDNISNLKELLEEKDAEIKRLAEEEQINYEKQIISVDRTLTEAILPEENDEYPNGIVLEVKAGVGGQEAMLFANEMFHMYCNFINYKKWDYEVAEYDVSELGGIRHGSILVSAIDAFHYLKHEAGVHRVQRIPTTEKSGRIHTSTVSVNAIPQPNDVEILIPAKDLRIETKKASGAGGQHVNTTDSAVRITHLPTGISVECQTNRSQIKNRQLALRRLRSKLYEKKFEEQQSKLAKMKKSQVKSSFRNEKIRTYNFPQDRITDHRVTWHTVHNIKVFMIGGEPLEDLMHNLNYRLNIEKLQTIVDLL